MANKSWHVRDKWLRHRALAHHPMVGKYVPATHIFSKQTFFRYLNRYSSVFVKPVYGSFGKGVMKISRLDNRYQLRFGTKSFMFQNQSQIFNAVNKLTGGHKYLIQRAINLISIRKRPVDFRVLLLKPGRTWQYMGTIGKVAAPRKVVTNFSNGGQAIALKQALQRGAGVSHARFLSLRKQISSLGLQVSRVFNRSYKNVRKMGIDIAIDSNQNLWILEINTNPRFQLFRRHPNKRLYEIIRRQMNLIDKRLK